MSGKLFLFEYSLRLVGVFIVWGGYGEEGWRGRLEFSFCFWGLRRRLERVSVIEFCSLYFFLEYEDV